MSKIGAGKSPGGSPLKTMVPPRRVSPMAWPKACGCTAVTSTPCTPPVAFCTSATTSLVRALTATSAEAGGQGELGVVDFDGDHAETHCARVLDGDVAESADP